MTFDPRTMLFTGGSGLLGRSMRALLPEASYPPHAEFDVTDPQQMDRYVAGRGFRTLVHAAAATSPPKIENDPLLGLEVNALGSANVARLCLVHGLKLVYVSTDYVFRGDRGNYQEDDELLPVNLYAWSKLAGECAARLVPRSLIVRTTFGPPEFPYPRAFVDQWTSRQAVAVVARKLVRVVERDLDGVIHLGGRRQTVFAYAQSLDPQRELGRLSIRDVDFPVPADPSLDCGRFERLEETDR